MNNQQLENAVRKDVADVKKDLSALVGDSGARLNKLDDDMNRTAGKAKEDLTKWVKGSVYQVNEGIEKLATDTKVAVSDAAISVKKGVGHGLSQYNIKAQQVADSVPGGFAKSVARYPWVTISIALALGFMLGSILKPTRMTLG